MAEVKGRAAWRRRRAIRLYRKAHALDPDVPLGSILLVVNVAMRESDGRAAVVSQTFDGISAVSLGYPTPTAESTWKRAQVVLQAPIASHGLDS